MDFNGSLQLHWNMQWVWVSECECVLMCLQNWKIVGRRGSILEWQHNVWMRRERRLRMRDILSEYRDDGGRGGKSVCACVRERGSLMEENTHTLTTAHTHSALGKKRTRKIDFKMFINWLQQALSTSLILLFAFFECSLFCIEFVFTLLHTHIKTHILQIEHNAADKVK